MRSKSAILATLIAWGTLSGQLAFSQTASVDDDFLLSLVPIFSARFDLAGNTGTGNATIAIGNTSVVSDASGNWSASRLAPGSYQLIPSKAGCAFSPSSITVRVGPSARSLNFTASCSTGGTGGTTPPPGSNPPPPTAVLPPVNVTLASDVLVRSNKLTGGSSGYQVVYEVDVTKVSKVNATSKDPYWWQYYRKFWADDGTFIGNTSGDWDAGKTSFFDGTWYSGGWQTIANGGIPSANTTYFPYATYFDTRFPYTSYRVNTNQPDQVYFQHHFRNRIGSQWVPGKDSLGPNYYVPSQGGVTLNFLIELYRYKVYEAPSYYLTGASGWETVIPGEVRADGWGIVPAEPFVSSNKGGVQWILIKPKNANLNVRTSSSQCPRTGVVGEYPVDGAVPCIIDPPLWVDDPNPVTIQNGTCSSDALSPSACSQLSDQTLSPADVEFIKKVQEQEAFGGDSLPDFNKDGTIHVINPDGTHAEITLEQAIGIVRAYHVFDVNGSLNSLNGALGAASSIAARTGRPIVMVYMAQGLDYDWSPSTGNIPTKLAVASVLDGVQGVGVTVIAHSWSAQLVARYGSNYANLDMYLLNPAQYPSSYTALQFLDSIRNSRSLITILAGTNDAMSQSGAGQWLAGTFGGCVANCSLRDAINSNPRTRQINIPGAGHGVSSMLENGAGNYITLH